MLVVTASAALMMTAYAADRMEDARDSYNNCMIDQLLQHLDRKDSKKIFANATKTMCDKQRNTFHTIVVKDERGYGSSEAEANAYADEEVQGLLDSHIENYAGYLKNNTRPQR